MSVDQKARKRDRRARKGGAVANGNNLALKLQSAITELEGTVHRTRYSLRIALVFRYWTAMYEAWTISGSFGWEGGFGFSREFWERVY